MNSDQVFDMLEVVANASGHSKFSLLHDKMKLYLKWAYDPYKRFYLTDCANGHGTKVFSEETSKILRALSVRQISGYHAQDIVNNHTRELTKKSAFLFLRILRKDLRIGMAAKSINKVFPGLIPVHDVMLAKVFDPDRIMFPCYAGLKIDCVRAVYNPGTEKFYSRNGHEYFGLSHIVNEIIKQGIETKIDVELAVKGGKFQWGSGKIRNHQSTPDAVAHIIELPEEKGSFLDRLNTIKEITREAEYLIEIPHIIVRTHDEAFTLFKTVRKAGHEGLILRSMDYDYVNKRSFDWQKMKNIMDFDLKVIDIYEGKGKYKNQLGGVIVKYKFQGKGKTPTKFNRLGQKVGGGFSDWERISFWSRPDKIISKTIQVIITEFTDDGNFRHARMGEQKIRKDK